MVNFLWKVGDWFAKWKGGALDLLVGACSSILDNQVIRIYRLKNRLINLRAVTYVIRGRMCFRAARDQSRNYWLSIFSETVAG